MDALCNLGTPCRGTNGMGGANLRVATNCGLGARN